jgi:hypothetical protein
MFYHLLASYSLRDEEEVLAAQEIGVQSPLPMLCKGCTVLPTWQPRFVPLFDDFDAEVTCVQSGSFQLHQHIPQDRSPLEVKNHLSWAL